MFFIYKKVSLELLLFFTILNISLLIQWKLNEGSCLITTYTDKLMKSKNIIINDDCNGFRNIIHLINGTYSSMKKNKLLNEKNKLTKIEKFVYLNIIVYIIMIIDKLNI